jgi:hypothetical protein
MNLLGDNINTIKKNKETYANKDVVPKINAEKNKHTLHQNAVQNHDIKIANVSF